MMARGVLEEAISQAVTRTKLSLSLQQESSPVCRLQEQNILKEKVGEVTTAKFPAPCELPESARSTSIFLEAIPLCWNVRSTIMSVLYGSASTILSRPLWLSLATHSRQVSAKANFWFPFGGISRIVSSRDKQWYAMRGPCTQVPRRKPS